MVQSKEECQKEHDPLSEQKPKKVRGPRRRSEN